MIGYHACSVLADMMLKGVRGFDYERAFQAMKTTATNPHYDCIPEYTSLGYVPFDKEKESVSKNFLNMPTTIGALPRRPSFWVTGRTTSSSSTGR